MSDDGVSAILLLLKWENDDTSLTKLGMPQTHRSSRPSPVQVAVEHPEKIRIDLAELQSFTNLKIS